MLHGVNSGTDTPVTWVRLLYVGCGLAVLGAVVARTAAGTTPMQHRPPAHPPSLGVAMTATTLDTPVTGAIWTIGTPRLLAGLDRHDRLDARTHLEVHRAHARRGPHAPARPARRRSV